jgi:SOS-response transcriptional repressor LexA
LRRAVVCHVTSLTVRQEMVLTFIRQHITTHGYPPTLREIAKHMDIRSTNGVNDHLLALEKKGYIRRAEMLSRGIVVVDPPVPPPIAPSLLKFNPDSRCKHCGHVYGRRVA